MKFSKRLKLRSVTSKISVIGAKDDPIVPYSHIENLVLRLNAKLIKLDNGGHFLKLDGYDHFYRVLYELESIINRNEIKEE